MHWPETGPELANFVLSVVCIVGAIIGLMHVFIGRRRGP